MELFLSSSLRRLCVGRTLFCPQGGWWALQQAELGVDSQLAPTREQRKQHGYPMRSLQRPQKGGGNPPPFPFSVL